jgi:CelD/BcsL family acetyltransferase involved in cellulose biosynthesis
MPTATVVCDPARLGPLEDGWRRLAELAGNPYLTPEWHAACRARPGAGAVVVAVRGDGGELRGVLPLVRAAGRPLRWLRFPGDDLGDSYEMLVAPGDDPGEVARLAGRGLRAAGLRWDALALYYVDDGAPWLAGLLDGLGGMATMRRSEAVRPYIDLSGGDWEHYLSTLKRTDRKETRRRERRVLEAGAAYRLLDDPAEAAEGMAVLFRLHDMRWSEKGGSSLAAQEPRTLLTRFATDAAARGWLRLWLLEMEGEPVAAELAWRLGTRQCHYQGGFDPARQGLGVGLVLFAHALEEAVADGVAEADLGWGESDYKRRYGQGARTVPLMVAMRRRHPLRPAVAAALRGRRELAARLTPEHRARLSRILRRR